MHQPPIHRRFRLQKRQGRTQGGQQRQGGGRGTVTQEASQGWIPGIEVS